MISAPLHYVYFFIFQVVHLSKQKAKLLYLGWVGEWIEIKLNSKSTQCFPSQLMPVEDVPASIRLIAKMGLILFCS